MTFDECYFNTNFNNEICHLAGGSYHGPHNAAVPFINCQIIKNCHFFNGGLNSYPSGYTCPSGSASSGASGNIWLIAMDHVNFIGQSSLTYSRYAGINCLFGNTRIWPAGHGAAPFDYVWGINACYKDDVPIPNIAFGESIINSYYLHNAGFTSCFNPGGTPPFDFGMVAINDGTTFQTAQPKFENPTSLSIFCPQHSEPVTGLCALPPFRIAASQFESSLIHSKIKISPVPSSDFVTVENIIKGDNIRLFDTMGNLVLEVEAENNTFQIDLRSLASGIYFIYSNNRIPEKIIKSDANK
ncbi:MAG: T9SS type A sorting domain-containing protein [Bacteroidota bacterium]